MPLQADTDVNASTNILGASIFWLYIVAALLTTGIILSDITRLYASRTRSSASPTKSGSSILRRQSQRDGTLLTLMALSLLSFTVLSYHMLSFLIDSYCDWAIRRGYQIPQRILGSQGIVSIDQRSGLPLIHLNIHPWQWSITSTLFRDFARVICNDPRRYWWTQLALLFSFGWNVLMAERGARAQVPRLWVYFVLDQILPLSFTQNLFSVALLLVRSQRQDATTSSHESEVTTPSKTMQWCVVTAYTACLIAAPLSIDRRWNLGVLFLTRALLFAPYVLRPRSKTESRTSSEKPPSVKALTVGTRTNRAYSTVVDGKVADGFFAMSGALLALQTWRAMLAVKIVSTYRLASLMSALSDSHAVAALGYDLIIALGSLVVYFLVV